MSLRAIAGHGGPALRFAICFGTIKSSKFGLPLR
jgi:hypothetical protein